MSEAWAAVTRRPAAWIFGGMLLLGTVITVAEQEWFHRISPSGWALSWVLVLAYAAPVFLLVYLLDRFDRESWVIVLAALAWGGLVAAALAGIANEGWGLVVERIAGPDIASVWTVALTAPLVEESLKVCGVILLILAVPRPIDDVMDGFVYGAMVGLGFAIVEDVFYFMAVFGGSTGGIVSGFFVRVIGNGVYGHVLYAGLAGLGVAYFIKHEGRFGFWRRFAVAAGLFLIAVGAHFLWNTAFLSSVVRVIPLIVLIAMTILLGHRRECRWLRDAADTPACADVLLPEECAGLSAWGGARRARRIMRARAGADAAKLLRRLQAAQIDLAMLRSRSGDDADPDVRRQRSLCRSLRDALSAIPGAAPARQLHPSAAG